jgi:hypothetical protein
VPLTVVAGLAATGMVYAQNASTKATGEEALAPKTKFKIELIEDKDANGKDIIKADIKDKNGNNPSPITDPSDIITTPIYDFVVITAIRYQGSSCTRTCRTLSNGTTTCYKVCS